MAALLAMLTATAAVAGVPRLPAAAYGRLPAITDAAISPDGKNIVMACTTPEGGQSLRVIDTESGANVAARSVNDKGSETERSVMRTVGWADDGHVTYLMSATFRVNRVLPQLVSLPGVSRLDVWHTGITDLATRRNFFVSRNENDQGLRLARLIAPIEGDPGKGRLVTYNSLYRGARLTVYAVNLSNGRVARKLVGEQDTIEFLLDEHGEAIARIDADKASNSWRLFALDAGRAPRLLKKAVFEISALPDMAGRLPDGSFVFIGDPDQRGRNALYAVSPKDGAMRVLIQDAHYDVSEPIADPWSHHIVGATVETQQFLEHDLAATVALVQALDPSAVVRLLNWSRDRSKFVFYFERASDAGGFYVFEPARKQMRLIGMRYPELTGDQLGNREAVTYPARDGVRIPGYLTLPVGRAPHQLPLVVLVHGGPSARDTFEFDWWASFLASRGYAVLQPNYRGSAGYGREWEHAGYRQWGELMQHDVEDAAASLTRMGLADGTRICIVGASYGGYAALAGATLTPDRYRCAVSVAGVSDLPMMLLNVENRSGSDSVALDWWSMLIGDRGKDKDHLRAISPAYQAARVRAPILLIHGANDTVVPIEQSRRMAAQLKAAGRQVRLVEFAGEDHWLSDAVTRIQMLNEIEVFLAAQLGTDNEGKAAN